MANILPYPPVKSPMGSHPWLTWFIQLHQRMGGTTSLDSTSLEIMQSFEGISEDPEPQPVLDFEPPQELPGDVDSLESPATHNGLGDLQGGQPNPEEYFHLTQAQHTLVSGLSEQTALTTVEADAPAGGTGTADGGWATAADRDTAITLLNNLKTRVGEIENRLQNLGLLA